MLQIAQITIIICLLAIAIRQVTLSESCDNDGGVCIQITKCPYAIELIKQKNLLFLKNISCGFNDTQPLVCCKLQKAEDKVEFNPQKSTTPQIPQYYITPNIQQYYTTPNVPQTNTVPPPPANTQPHKQSEQPININEFITPNVNNTNHVTSNNFNRVSDQTNTVPQEYNINNVPSQGFPGSASSFIPQTNTPSRVTQEKRVTNSVQQEFFVEEEHGPINSRNNSFIRFQLPDIKVCGVEELSDRIYGGDITDIHEFPWMARLKYIDGSNKMEYLCGGALISDRYVLTAAHCIENKEKKLIEVRLGEWNAEEDVDCDMLKQCSDRPVDIPVEKAIAHPSFSYNNHFIYGDIAILRLQRAVANYTPFIRPICLPSTPDIVNQDISTNNPYWATGWGKTEYGTTPAIKHKVSLKAVQWETCRASFNISEEDASKIICAGGRRGEDTCHGDSGGPLMRMVGDNWFLFGIVSLGSSQCGQAGRPAIYTRVSTYMNWINSQLRT